jgi:hypothetical protein
MLFYGPRTLRRVCPPARAVPPRSSTCPFAAVCIMAPRRLAVRSHTAPKCAYPRVTVAVLRHLSAAFRATPCIFRGYSTRLRLFDLKTPHGATREGGVTVLRRSSAAVRPCDTSCRLLWCVVTAPASALCRRSSATVRDHGVAQTELLSCNAHRCAQFHRSSDWHRTMARRSMHCCALLKEPSHHRAALRCSPAALRSRCI